MARGVELRDVAQARAYGLVGPIARASGITGDLRKLFPYAAYDTVDFTVAVEQEGDAYARLRILFREAEQSVAIMRQLLAAPPQGAVCAELVAWRHDLAEHWREVRFGAVRVDTCEGRHQFSVEVYLGRLDPGALRVELFADPIDGGEAERHTMARGPLIEETHSGFEYIGSVSASRPAGDYTARLVPDHPEAAVPLEVRSNAFSIISEALTNARKHSGATSALVHLSTRGEGMLAKVTDEGAGFSPDGNDPSDQWHLGMSDMHERAEMGGGWLRVESSPGQGAAVEFFLPFPAPSL